MEAVTLQLISQLIRGVREHALADSEYKNSKGDLTRLASKISTPFLLFGTTEHDLIEHTDEEFEIVSFSCDYAARTLALYTEHMRSTISSRRNKRLAIYRLTDDVLAVIFEFVVGSRSNCLRPLMRKAPLNISHVSRKWRKVAFEAPRLWAQYEPMNARISHIFLDRTRSTPLNIELHSRDADEISDDEDLEEPHLSFPVPLAPAAKAYRAHLAKFAEFIQPVIPYVGRWGVLNLEGVRETELNFLSCPTPNLKIVRLKSIRSDPSTTSYAQLLDALTPSLRELYLRDLRAPPLTSPIYAGLTVLKLQEITYEGSMACHLLDILVVCPLLERLSLESLKFDESPGTEPLPHTPLSIPLTRLKSMQLSFLNTAVTQTILLPITIPPTASLLVDIKAYSDADVRAIFPSTFDISKSLPNTLSISWCYLQLVGNTLYMDGGAFGSGAPLLKVGVHQVTGFYYSDLVIPDLAQVAFPLSVRSLSFDFVEHWTIRVPIFVRLLASATVVTSLTFSGCSWSAVEALAITPTSHLCPLLRDLRLRGVQINNAALLRLVKSRTCADGGDGGQPELEHVRLSSLVLSSCTGLDFPTLLALRELPLQVQALGPDSPIKNIKYNQVR
ncbi:hypothetical protein BOTBODRAFT_342991 [Botryobasidium botryosum FD-172 SS1]|uniref:F-box domain-containing protein n=1 Tax=Botryobasidium botryosum (strain FD-172 SS1) TaxID=930990 RepID=A0A067MFB6_BOTB1|nr:hypothetical protein BOTBODRAFT_342991 [Botryobasidium botryosum FD-172 SS1]